MLSTEGEGKKLMDRGDISVLVEIPPNLERDCCPKEVFSDYGASRSQINKYLKGHHLNRCEDKHDRNRRLAISA